MLAVASAYSGLLDLCPYFSIVFVLLLSYSVVTPSNLVVVVGGVTITIQASNETDSV
jgi:hypothetical protein